MPALLTVDEVAVFLKIHPGKIPEIFTLVGPDDDRSILREEVEDLILGGAYEFGA